MDRLSATEQVAMPPCPTLALASRSSPECSQNAMNTKFGHTKSSGTGSTISRSWRGGSPTMGTSLVAFPLGSRACCCSPVGGSVGADTAAPDALAM